MVELLKQRPRLLITGGAGLLGVNWALATRERYSVTLGLHQRSVSFLGVEAKPVGLGSVEEISRSLEEITPTLVIHAAGLSNVEACEADPQLAWRTNVELSANVARACARAEVPLVHVSTDHLFSAETPLATEDRPVSPLNVYGRTKVEAEARVLDVHARALVVRTNFYGWGPGYRRSFSDFVLTALREGRALTLFQDVFYTPILIEALVRAVHELLECKVCGIFNVVGDERLSKLEFGLRLAQQFGLNPAPIRPANFSDQSTLVQRPREMSLSNEKARRVLGGKLGGVDEQLRRLQQQEQLGLAREVRGSE